MVAPVNADIVIVGGGCAGLSLAAQLGLGGRARTRRVLVLEPRREYTRDRTWCYWPVEPHLFADAVSDRWSRWELLAPGRRVERGAARLPYVQLPGDAFYRAARARLAAAGIELHLGVHVDRLDDRGDHVLVDSSAGTVRASLVFDSRPGAPPDPRELTLLQHFVGWELRAPRPVFTPGLATLMDFTPSQRGGLHFFYVLPYAADRALVEATYFTPALLPDDAYDAAIRGYLRERFGLEDFEILMRERGVIPMTTAPAAPRQSPRIYNLGLRGGVAKASTGYAFLAIQRTTRDLARRLRDAPPGALIEPPEPRGALAVAMDRVFLSQIARYPERAPDLFLDLFEKLPPELLIRFLSDQATPVEAMRVMASTPLAAMTREVLRSRARWLRPAVAAPRT